MSARRTSSAGRTGPREMLRAVVWLLLLHLLQTQALETTTKSTHTTPTPLVCARGLTTPGVTIPQGDIVLEVGSSLEIFCVLNVSHPSAKYHNASDLRFYRNDAPVGPEYLTVMNETTLRLYDEETTVSKTMYYCKLKPRNGEKEVGVCLNTVMIGYKPQPVDNFNCTSYNWMNLKCTWEPRYNPIPTTYNLSFRLSGSPQNVFGCPNNTERENMCYWDDSTSIPYRQVYDKYYFTFVGENQLTRTTFPYITFEHYKNIIAGKPSEFRVLNKTSSSFYLQWKIPYPLDSWAASNVLEQKIAYAYMGAKEDNDSEEPWHVAFQGSLNCPKSCTFNLTDLRYAHVLYDVRVYLKTQQAPERYWSEPASIVQRTTASIPPEPPRTIIGGFEVSGRLPNRDVTIYWQSLPEKLHAGNDFSYKIVDVLQDGASVPLKANFTGKKSAVFRNISSEHDFLVHVASANELGLSPTYSAIYIPRASEILPEPRSFTKTPMNNGVFKLTWDKPERNEHLIKSYTIFWCDSQNDRPETCTGLLNWTRVHSSTRNVSLSLKPIMYHFAISANSEKASSGMVWASCSMLSDKVDRLKTVWTKTDSAMSMSVYWKLDCTDANNVVRGFQIFYCTMGSVNDKDGQQCKDAEKNITIAGDHTTSRVTLTDLQPYRTYRVSVAIVTKIGAGLKSEPVYCTLLEAAPASPPINVRVSNITNSSMNVSWSPPPIPNGVLRYYEVHFNGNVIKKLVDDYLNTSNRPQVDEHVVLNDLNGYTNYSVQVKACTNACSDLSDPIIRRTLIGAPGKIGTPELKYLNRTLFIVRWQPPAVPGGKLDYYLLSVRRMSSESDNEPLIYNVTGTEYQVPTRDCNGGGLSFNFSVRAVNVDGDDEYMGQWSESLIGPCLQDPQILYYVLISILVGVGILSALGAVVAAKSLLRKCGEMKRVPVKIPEGMVPPSSAKDPNFTNFNNWGTGGRDNDDPSGKTRPAADKERLLQRKEDGHGESSGCSSGHDTASSSTTSGTHISTDSGTEVDQHEPGYNDSNNWQANADAIEGQKREKLLPPAWDSYHQIGGPPSNAVSACNVDTKTSGASPGYPNIGVATTWLPSGYVAMSGTGSNPNSILESPIPVISPVVAPQTKSSGYVAHNAPLLTQAPWSSPVVADGYVQMGSKPEVAPPENDEGVIDDDKEEDDIDDVQLEEVGVELDADHRGLRPLAAKSPRLEGDGDVEAITDVGDDCERTSAEAPLVPVRMNNGYVSNSVPLKSSPCRDVRHESARTAEKSPSISVLDSAKPYMRVGEAAAFAPAPRPEVFGATKSSASSGYVPHLQFETRPAPGVVRD